MGAELLQGGAHQGSSLPVVPLKSQDGPKETVDLSSQEQRANTRLCLCPGEPRVYGVDRRGRGKGKGTGWERPTYQDSGSD